MIPRGTIIAALAVVELAIVGEAVAAFRGSDPAASVMLRVGGPPGATDRLVEGGPHRVFSAGSHPALSVDIGYADLTIVTGTSAQIDISSRASRSSAIFQETTPVISRMDGDEVRISKSSGPSWTVGDDRMLTVVVPPQTQVSVVSAGDIRARGLRAPASFKSVGSGTITIEDDAAPTLRAETANGRIVMREVDAGRLDVTSNGGSVEGTNVTAHDGSIDGDERVTLGFAAATNALVTADGDSGHVSVTGFPAATRGKNASLSGDDTDAALRIVQIGAGAGHLSVHSDDGNIHLFSDV